jgi:hypothetical protein
VAEEDMDSEWFELSKKRDSRREEDSDRPRKQAVPNAEQERRDAKALLKKYSEQYVKDKEEDASQDSDDMRWDDVRREMGSLKSKYLQDLTRHLKEAGLSDYVTAERLYDEGRGLRQALEHTRDEYVKELKKNIDAYDAYRLNVPAEGSVRDALDEFYELQREDLGRLRDLRWDTL